MPPGHARSEVAKAGSRNCQLAESGLCSRRMAIAASVCPVKHDPFTPGRAVWHRLGRARSGVRLRSANLNN